MTLATTPAHPEMRRRIAAQKFNSQSAGVSTHKHVKLALPIEKYPMLRSKKNTMKNIYDKKAIRPLTRLKVDFNIFSKDALPLDVRGYIVQANKQVSDSFGQKP